MRAVSVDKFWMVRLKVYRLQANSSRAFHALRKLHDETDFDFWQAPSIRHDTDILVNENQERELQEFMDFYRIDHSILIEDLDRCLHKNSLKLESMRKINIRLHCKYVRFLM